MRKALFTLILSSVSIYLFAQGKLSGTVKDGNTGEAMMAANLSLVKIEGADTTPVAATTTEIDGTFMIEVPEGNYVLTIDAFGYQTKAITDVEIKDKQTNTVNIALTEPAKNEMQEVVITGSLHKENISALYTIQKNSAAVSDGISADVIKKSPDRSTGEVLKRVSGTTIQDNKFVIVRGMSDRYNVAMMDGAILPSTEPNRRAFSFDIIPANMIDNIVITKSATPDQPGDFAGGLINILTKEVPDENFNSLSIGVGFNTVATFNTFKSGYRTGTDFLGFDNGDRQLPKDFPSSSKLTSTNLNADQSKPYLESLNNDFTIKEHAALPAINLQGSMGRIYNLKHNNRFGFTAALSYNHNEAYKKDLERQYDNYNYLDNQYTYSTNLGALLNLGYYFKNSKITLKTLYNRTFDDNFLFRTGTNISSGSDVNFYAFDLIQKSLFKTTLSGDHQIGKGQSKLNWILSYNYITNNQPDQRKVSYARPIGTDDTYQANVTSLGKDNNRLFSNLNESISNGGINYSVPLKLFTKTTFKAGVFGQYRYRKFDNRYIGALLEQGFDDVRAMPIQSLFSQQNIENGAYALEEISSPADAYTANATTLAAYLMMDNKFTEKFRAVWGLRAEQYNFTLNSDQTFTKKWTDLLPSVNLTYSLNDISNLRLSYFRSVARPEMREMASLSYYDYELSATVNGNTDLNRSQIDNFDFRYEIYPKAGEVLSASVFFKKFRNTLENAVNSVNSSYDITTINYPGATNFGAELEIRKKLDFISNTSALFRNLTFYLNLAYTHSVVDSSSYYVNDKKVDSRPLSGQSPFIINTNLSYQSTDGKWNATVLYNRIGQRLFLVGGGRLGSVYECPRNLLDFQLSYALSKRSELRLNVKDILNNPIQFYFDQDANGSLGKIGFNADGTINSNEDWILQKYKPGTTISLTYSMKF